MGRKDSFNYIITEEKLKKYFSVTKNALDKLKEVIPKKTHLDNISKDYLDMAKNYYNDARFFYDKGDYVNAFAALNYSHGWLDAGARLGLWDVGYDNKLFTVDEKDEK